MLYSLWLGKFKSFLEQFQFPGERTASWRRVRHINQLYPHRYFFKLLGGKRTHILMTQPPEHKSGMQVLIERWFILNGFWCSEKSSVKFGNCYFLLYSSVFTLHWSKCVSNKKGLMPIFSSSIILRLKCFTLGLLCIQGHISNKFHARMDNILPFEEN